MYTQIRLTNFGAHREGTCVLRLHPYFLPPHILSVLFLGHWMATLPFRGTPGAPTFDGIATHLNRYFTDIDDLYSRLGIQPTDQQKVFQAKMYLDFDTCDLWDTLTPPPTSSTISSYAAVDLDHIQERGLAILSRIRWRSFVFGE